MSDPSVETPSEEMPESSEEMADSSDQNETTPEDISPAKDGKLLKEVIKEGKGRSRRQ